MEWMIMPLKRYADFQGRSRRKEYWMFTLLIALVMMALFVPIFALGMASSGSGDGSAFGVVGGLGMTVIAVFYLAILCPALAVQVRRFHDQDRSGWMILLGFIPYVGGLILLVFMCLEGTRGPNRFGPDPKGRAHEDVFA